MKKTVYFLFSMFGKISRCSKGKKYTWERLPVSPTFTDLTQNARVQNFYSSYSNLRNSKFLVSNSPINLSKYKVIT